MSVKTASSNLIGGGKEKTIETENLRIQGHLLQWADVVIQISNISLITAADMPLPPFPLWAGVLGLIGILLLETEFAKLVGVLFLLVAGVFIYMWFHKKQESQNHKYLNILLNSGNTYSIVFQNESFLQQVLQIFANIFEEGSQTGTNYYIDLNGCTIDNQSSIVNAL